MLHNLWKKVGGESEGCDFRLIFEFPIPKPDRTQRVSNVQPGLDGQLIEPNGLKWGGFVWKPQRIQREYTRSAEMT